MFLLKGAPTVKRYVLVKRSSNSQRNVLVKRSSNSQRYVLFKRSSNSQRYVLSKRSSNSSPKKAFKKLSVRRLRKRFDGTGGSVLMGQEAVVCGKCADSHWTACDVRLLKKKLKKKKNEQILTLHPSSDAGLQSRSLQKIIYIYI